jgi:ribosomal protein S18 acetylase RimI-like enzyme
MKMNNEGRTKRLTDKDFNSYNELLEQVDLLHRQAHPEYFRKPETTFRTREYYEKHLNDSNVLLLGAFDKRDELIGLVHAAIKGHPQTVLHVPGQYVLLDNLVVDEKHRGKGIGKELYDQTVLWGKENKANEIQLKVYNFNESAIEFYKKRGFKQFNISMRQSLE